MRLALIILTLFVAHSAFADEIPVGVMRIKRPKFNPEVHTQEVSQNNSESPSYVFIPGQTAIRTCPIGQDVVYASCSATIPKIFESESDIIMTKSQITRNGEISQVECQILNPRIQDIVRVTMKVACSDDVVKTAQN